MGSGNFPYRKGQLYNRRLCHCLGLRHQVCGKCRADCERHMFRDYDRHVCVSRLSSRLWKLWSMAPAGLDGGMLGVRILYDVYQAFLPMASWHGSIRH